MNNKLKHDIRSWGFWRHLAFLGLTAMLASGKPILATASLGSELADTVEGSGLIVPPENPDRFYEALITLANNIDLRDSLGRHARRYAESKLDSDRVLYEFKRKMELLIS